MPDNSCKFVSILITSCKGGVGKSTVTANLALALARRGKRVLAVDCDFSNRTLDLLFGCEDVVLYDLCDVIAGRAKLADALLTDRRSDLLQLLPAPFLGENEPSTLIDAAFTASFEKLLREAGEETGADFILIDTPGSADALLTLAAQNADMALIVTGHHPAAIRGAEKTGLLLDSRGVPGQKLILNRFDIDAVMDGRRPGINTIIDMTRTPILGVIPEDRALEFGQESGKLYTESADRNTARAIDNLAARLCGESRPLFSGFRRVRRRRLVER